MIVTTPEKWDVVTRKGGDGSLVSSVGLIMIDEVRTHRDGAPHMDVKPFFEGVWDGEVKTECVNLGEISRTEELAG